MGARSMRVMSWRDVPAKVHELQRAHAFVCCCVTTLLPPSRSYVTPAGRPHMAIIERQRSREPF
eukprot:6489620-Amphidinium_carterae.3